MILVFGGAYQGKLAYARERFDITNSDVYFCDENSSAVPRGMKLIYELDKWVLALIKAGLDVDNEIKRFTLDNKDAIVICNDISCGVVPEDPIQRKWREFVGRALSELARESDEVVRLFCGIPTTLADKPSEVRDQ